MFCSYQLYLHKVEELLNVLQNMLQVQSIIIKAFWQAQKVYYDFSLRKI